MVDAKAIITGYECNKCHKKYTFQTEANHCCEKKVINWEFAYEFELKQVHLDLLKEAWVSWDSCEFGAPEIDCKRPYGNSDVYDDIAEIIHLNKKDNWNYNEEEWTDEATDYMLDLHKQTQIALQIVLHTQSFKLGKYIKKDYKWIFQG